MTDKKLEYTKINWISIYQQYTENIIINNFLKHTPFAVAAKNIRYLRINIRIDMQDLL